MVDMRRIIVVFLFNFYLKLSMCTSVDMRLVALRKACVAETGIDEAFVEKVDAEKVLVDDRTLKCYIMCIMKHCGAMSDDGIVDIESVVSNLTDEMKEKLEPIVRACGAKVGADHCETAWLTHSCFLEKGPDVYVFV
uniref:Odorant-binding protein n=1 Tax=Anoplophora chinensis TaxID=217632 RepID=A0A2H4ZB49_ANOCN|nr:odorant-binding protein [Anoplophora chinensis]